MVVPTRSRLLEPVLSAMTPIPNAASAHVSDNALDRNPACVLLSPNSGWMNGSRKPVALRSNSTKPKFRLRTEVRAIWYPVPGLETVDAITL